MFRLILIALLLTGCASQSNQPISTSDRELVEKAVVVSTLGDELGCSFVGLTIFNNKSNTYELDPKFNKMFSSSISSQLNSMGMDVTPLPRSGISFTDDAIGAKNWGNIKLSGAPGITDEISSIIILDGRYQYNSTGGYYARDNALGASATLYVYEVSTGRLIGKSSYHLSKLKRSFSCTQEKIPDSGYMLDLIENSGVEVLKVVFDDLFGMQESHNKSNQ